MPKVFQLNYEDNFEIEKELLGKTENQETDRGKINSHEQCLFLLFLFSKSKVIRKIASLLKKTKVVSLK
jgi:hypothetical protein